MTSKAIIPSARAEEDVDSAIDYCYSEGAQAAALGFIAALEKAYQLIGRHPGAGAFRAGFDLGIQGLRCLSLSRFPYLVFYVEYTEHIDMLRVLHSARDALGAFGEEEAVPEEGL